MSSTPDDVDRDPALSSTDSIPGDQKLHSVTVDTAQSRRKRDLLYDGFRGLGFDVVTGATQNRTSLFSVQG